MKIHNILAPLLMSTALCAADAPVFDTFRLIAAETQGNLAYSPTGVESLLRILKNYSAGETLEELKALNLSEKTASYNINTTQADGLFVDNKLPLVPGVSNVEQVDFTQGQEAANTINNWFDKHTNGLIKKLVRADDFSSLTAFVATNALYLKAKWQHPFTSGDGEFILSDGSRIETNMMRCTSKFPTAVSPDWTAVALPYEAVHQHGESCWFIAICPKENVRSFAARLTQNEYKKIIDQLSSRGQQTRVIMPSFTIEGNTLNLNNALKEIGLKQIFRKANFSQLTTTTKDLYLSRVIQKCYVKVDEQGTEAAAVTAGFVNYRVARRPQTIELNRPFLWVISDLSGAQLPLFMGILEKP